MAQIEPAAVHAAPLDVPGEEIEQVQELIDAAVADSTKRVYGAYLGVYERWIEDRELPKSPETLALYLNARHRQGLSKSALEKTISAASWDDPDTFRGHEGVRAVLRGIRRIDLRPPGQVKGLIEDDFQAVRGTVDDPVTIALVSVMRDGLLRSQEAVDLVREDIIPESDGSGRVLVRFSKTDQTGAGELLYLSPRTMGDLALMRLSIAGGEDLEGANDAPVFPFRTTRTVRNRIKKAVAEAGLEGRYSGHSPRVGMAQDLIRYGFSVVELQQAGRWKTPSMPAHYGRGVLAGQGAVARYYGEEGT